MSERAPRFKDGDALDAVREELALYPASLVIVDPLYLAAAGGKGADLYAMGELAVSILVIWDSSLGLPRPRPSFSSSSTRLLVTCHSTTQRAPA